MKYLQYREKLDACYSAVLMDVLDSMGHRIQCMDPSIRPLNNSMKAWEEAVPIYQEAVTEVPEKPFQLEMELIDDLEPGQILVARWSAAASGSVHKFLNTVS